MRPSLLFWALLAQESGTGIVRGRTGGPGPSSLRSGTQWLGRTKGLLFSPPPHQVRQAPTIEARIDSSGPLKRCLRRVCKANMVALPVVTGQSRYDGQLVLSDDCGDPVDEISILYPA